MLVKWHPVMFHSTLVKYGVDVSPMRLDEIDSVPITK